MADRALVTGAAGFIGAHLVRRLLDEGADVVGLDDFSRGTDDHEIRDLARHAQLIRHDLRTPLPSEVGGHFDVVYHLAAVVGVGATLREPYRVLETNLLTTLNVLDWCRRHPPQVLFVSSTSEVADGATARSLAPFPTPESAPFLVEDLRHPRAAYALGKAAGEVLATHLGLDTRVRVARYHNIYGPRMGRAHVIPQLIERILAREEPFVVYGTSQRRAFCHVSDAVEATLRVVHLPQPAQLTVNIGDDRTETRIGDLVARLLDIAGWHPELKVVDPHAASPERRLPDLTILRTTTGYEPRMSLDDGLRDTFRWYRESWDLRGSA